MIYFEVRNPALPPAPLILKSLIVISDGYSFLTIWDFPIIGD